MSNQLLLELENILGENCLSDPADQILYGYDNSSLEGLADIIVLPESTEQVVQIIKIADKYQKPVITRGSGTNTCGATIPTEGGIVLSTQKLNKIISVNPDDRYAVVEPGVINQDLQLALSKHQMFWPPDPGSAKICTIGGNIGCNSAGPSAVKYGVTRDHILGLTFVTGDGKIVKTGVYTTKGVVGYDLTRLITGSQGTLGIITEAILKISPIPKYTHTLCAHFSDINCATQTITKLMKQQFLPSALELLDSNCLKLINNDPNLAIPSNSQSCLIIEVNGEEQEVELNSQTVYDIIINNPGCLSLQKAKSQKDRTRLWQARKALSPKLKYIAPHKINEDIAVPVSKLPELISYIENLANTHGINIVNFGHAGNGNIHVNLLIDPSDIQQKNSAETCLKNIFQKTLDLKGTLSGEHGIGLTKSEYAKLELSSTHRVLMQQIKSVFDPNNILNPQLTLS